MDSNMPQLGARIKIENPMGKLGDDDDTPLREEIQPLDDAEVAGAHAAGWNTDDDDEADDDMNETAMTTQPPPDLLNLPDDYFDDLLIDSTTEVKEEQAANELPNEELNQLVQLNDNLPNVVPEKQPEPDAGLKRKLTDVAAAPEPMEHSPEPTAATTDAQKKMRVGRTPSPECVERRPEQLAPPPAIERHIGVKAQHELVAPEQLDYVPVRPEERIPMQCAKSVIDEAVGQPIPTTIKEIRERSLQRVTECLNRIQLAKSKAADTEFLMVDTIRQIPKKPSYMNSGAFENPSPLCNNYNVRYKFNSTTADDIDISQWGLERLPESTTELLQLTGISVHTLMNLIANSKMPMKKLREQEEASRTKQRQESAAYSTGMGLYKTIGTQTDARMLKRSQDVGTQTNRLPPSAVYWDHPMFNETNLMQHEFNVMLALKELSASAPKDAAQAMDIFKALRLALSIKRNN